ncbi:hypothetical protein DXG01_003617 [Tephrocybe rancida]|nr:hypothetical protein DXG01_003617 [Tephrocybe rancida]
MKIQQTPLPLLLRRVDGQDGPLSTLNSFEYPLISTRVTCRGDSAALMDSEIPMRNKGKEPERWTEGPDILRNLLMPEEMHIPEEPLCASIARYHPPFDPLVDDDPLLQFGAIDGILPGKTSKESIELQGAVICWTQPHLGLIWATLPEAIEDMTQRPPQENQLQHYFNSAGRKEPTHFYTASPQVLYKVGQIILVVTQILDMMNQFVKGKKTHAYKLDPGFRNLRLMGRSEVAGEVIITYIFLGKQLSMALNRIKTYFNAIQRTYTNLLDVESVASFDSTNSDIRSNFAIFTPQTELAKLATCPSYAKLVPENLQGTADALVERLHASNIGYPQVDSDYSNHHPQVSSVRSALPPMTLDPSPLETAADGVGSRSGEHVLRFALPQLPKGLSAITHAHPISNIPGIGKLPEASALGLHYETPSKVKETGGPLWTRFSQIISAPFKSIRNAANPGLGDRMEPVPAAAPNAPIPANQNDKR